MFWGQGHHSRGSHVFWGQDHYGGVHICFEFTNVLRSRSLTGFTYVLRSRLLLTKFTCVLSTARCDFNWALRPRLASALNLLITITKGVLSRAIHEAVGGQDNGLGQRGLRGRQLAGHSVPHPLLDARLRLRALHPPPPQHQPRGNVGHRLKHFRAYTPTLDKALVQVVVVVVVFPWLVWWFWLYFLGSCGGIFMSLMIVWQGFGWGCYEYFHG